MKLGTLSWLHYHHVVTEKPEKSQETLRQMEFHLLRAGPEDNVSQILGAITQEISCIYTVPPSLSLK